MNIRLTAFKILWLSVFFIVLIVRFSFSPDQFADFESYVNLADQLYTTEISQWILFEPISNGILFLFRLLAGDSLNAVYLAYWYLSAVFLIGTAILCYQQGVTWQGVVLALGVYGALLAFVTVRATPAYILVALAVIQARNGQWRSILMCIIATTFHISAILSIPAIFVCVAQKRIKMCYRFFELNLVCYSIFFGIFLSSTLFHNQIIAFIIWVISSSGGAIEKYLTYVNDVESAKSNNHLIYFIISSVLVLVALNKNKGVISLRGYILTSYFLFSLLSFSPVTAFRQSLFWTIPTLLLIPWGSLFNNSFSSVLVIVVGLIFFGYGLNGVLT